MSHPREYDSYLFTVPKDNALGSSCNINKYQETIIKVILPPAPESADYEQPSSYCDRYGNHAKNIAGCYPQLLDLARTKFGKNERTGRS